MSYGWVARNWALDWEEADRTPDTAASYARRAAADAELAPLRLGASEVQPRVAGVRAARQEPRSRARAVQPAAEPPPGLPVHHQQVGCWKPVGSMTEGSVPGSHSRWWPEVCIVGRSPEVRLLFRHTSFKGMAYATVWASARSFGAQHAGQILACRSQCRQQDETAPKQALAAPLRRGTRVFTE